MTGIQPSFRIDTYMQDYLYDMDGTKVLDTDASEVLIYGQDWVNITADVKRRIIFERGIGGSNVNNRIADPGRAMFSLKNEGNSGNVLGYYSPDNANVRAGWQEDIKVRIGFSDSTYDSGNVNYRWHGWVNKIEPEPGKYRSREVFVTCGDYMGELQDYNKVTQVATQTNVTSDAVYTAIIAAMPRQPEGTNFSTGVDTLSSVLHRSGEQSGSGYEEINRVALSVLDYVFMDKDGQLVSQNRHDRIKDTTVQFTLTESLIRSDGSMKYIRDKSLGLDRVITKTYPIETGTSNENAFTLQNPVLINPGDSYTLEAKYRDPNSQREVGLTSSVTLAAGTNVSFGSSPDGASSDLNGSLTIVSQNFYSGEAVAVFRNDGTRIGYLNEVIIQGHLIRSFDPVTSTYVVNSSGNRTITLNMPYQDSEVFAENARKMINTVYGQTTRIDTVKMNLNDSTLFGYYMGTDTGDRIALTETVSGQNANEHFLNKERVEYTPGGFMNVTYTLAPSLITGAGILGTSKWNQANWAFAEG